MSDVDDFPSRLAGHGARVGEMLDALLAARPLPGEIERPARLLEAMRYATGGGGKRLRPFLVIEAARLCGAQGEGVLRAACAVELVHCYSLAHDDLPAMDDDDLRRGQPSLHKAYDEATAILAGDALLTYAFDVMADEATHADGGVRAELCKALARAAGVGGMAGGQMLDLAAEASGRPLPQLAVQKLQAMKTGAMLRFSAEAGAIVARAPLEHRGALADYGRALGAAFQISDDILDAEGDDATLGKRAGKDAGRNKATLVAILGLAGAKKSRARFIEQAEAALTPFGAAAGVLIAAARFTATRDH